MLFQPGHVPVPGYRLTRALGQGAFAVVWEAERADGSLFALKFLDRRRGGARKLDEAAGASVVSCGNYAQAAAVLADVAAVWR